MTRWRARHECGVALVTGWGAGLDPARARDLNIKAIIAKPYRGSVLDDLMHD